MNAWQAIRQVQSRILALKWSTKPSDSVVDACVIHDNPIPWNELIAQMTSPFVVLVPGDDRPDVEQPELRVATIQVNVVVTHEGGYYREPVIVGDHRSGGYGSSKGRGLLELCREIEVSLQYVGPASGFDQQGEFYGFASAQKIEGVIGATRKYGTFSAHVTTHDYYPPPSRIAAVNAGGGATTVSWSLPYQRFDLYKIVLRRASGSTPPPTVSDGTGVTLATDLATSVLDTPGAGTWSYSVFAGYDESGESTKAFADGYSELELGSYLTKVVA
jgi:hypothetical protein